MERVSIRQPSRSDAGHERRQLQEGQRLKIWDGPVEGRLVDPLRASRKLWSQRRLLTLDPPRQTLGLCISHHCLCAADAISGGGIRTKQLHAPVRPTLRAGSAAIFDYRLLHRGSPNLSERPRAMVELVYTKRSYSDRLNFSSRSVFE